MKKKKTTAIELLAELQADSEWVAEHHRNEDQRERRSEELRHAQAYLIADLKAAGVDINTINDLVNTSIPYPKALPILLTHLQRPYPPIIRQLIARALGVRPAKFAWDTLVKLFREEQDDQVKEGLAVALAAMADDHDLDEIIELLEDKSLGRKRVHLVRVLGRSKLPKARAALANLADDPQLRPEIQKFLRRRAKRTHSTQH